MDLFWDFGPDGALKTNTLNDTEQRLAKPEWDAMRQGFVCMSPQSFGDMRATIEKLCSDNPGLCRGEKKEKMQRFFARADKVSARNRR